MAKTTGKQARQPGQVRDAIVVFLQETKRPCSVKEIHDGVTRHLGGAVAGSSVRSYLGANAGKQRGKEKFRRVGHGKYEWVWVR